MQITIEDFHGFDVVVEVDESTYIAERPAPACSNPSSPAYSDPGDSAELEWDFISATPYNEDETRRFDDVMTENYNELDTAILTKYEGTISDE